LAKKLVDQYVSSYIINKVVFTNAVKLQLLTLIKIHPVVVEKAKEWEMEKILNKIKVRGVIKYLV